MARPQAQRHARGGARARALPRGAWALADGARLPDHEVIDLDVLREIAGGSSFVFEPLLAGARVLIARDGDAVHVVSESKRSLTRDLGRLARALAASKSIPEMFVAEGLLVALDASGRPSFDALKRALAANNDRELLLIVSDLLRVGDDHVSGRAYEVRRGHLASWTALPPGVALITNLGEDFEVARRAMLAVGLDGLVARPAGAIQDARATVCLVAARSPIETRRATSLSPAPSVTNATKVLFPRDGFTKQDLFSYYADIAPVLLPLMSKRPMVLQRWPDGIDEFMWYQHRVPPRAPDYLRVVPIEGNRRIAIDNADALLWLVNQAAITFHGFMSREGSLDHPDWLVLDLDPPDEHAWPRVVQVALALRKLLELLEVESVVKTSGQKGLHILVPLAPKQGAASVKLAARRITDLIERLLPNDTTQESDREKRRGRIFLDANQGHVGKTLVLPYSVRGTDGATISTPLRWSEVTPALDPRAFHLRTLRARLDREGDLTPALLCGKTDVTRLLARLVEAPK